MRCSQVQNLLPEYVEGALAAVQQEALAAHLHACPACTAEERSYQLAFDALNARKSSPAPDLWAAFSARLANELSCSEARELIPLHADPSLLGGRADALASHLAACQPCSAEASSMSRAITALDQVAAALPQVDLWPAFAARTANAPARTSLLGSIRRAVLPSRSPFAAPILTMAALAALLFGAKTVLNVELHQTQPGVPVATLPTGPSTTPASIPATAKNSATSSGPAVAKAKPVKSLRIRDSVRQQPHAVVEAKSSPIPAPKSHAVAIAKAMGSIRPHVRVAFDPGVTPTADGTLVSTVSGMDSNSDTAQARVMPEVVQAVALLLDFDDSANHPFGGSE